MVKARVLVPVFERLWLLDKAMALRTQQGAGCLLSLLLGWYIDTSALASVVGPQGHYSGHLPGR